MKYVKILGLLAVAAAALMAFAASASATTITGGNNHATATGSPYTETIKATVHTGKHAILQNPVAKIECHSIVEGKVESHGPGQTAKGKITKLQWGVHGVTDASGNLTGNCTNGWHVTTVAAGELEVHWKAEHEGTVTSNGATVEATRFGITCRYKTENTDIGTLTDSHKTGSTASPSTATFDIHGQIPFHSGSGLCGTGTSTWEGSYLIETPDTLFIDKE
jgi:hypothetical protein